MSGLTSRVVEVQAEALGPVLFAGVATALVGARGRARGLSHDQYPHLLPLLLRVELREFLSDNHLPPGWVVSGDPRKMGQLLLSNPTLGLELRVLKERRTTYPGGVPVAGGTNARRRAWTTPLPGCDWPSPSGTKTAALSVTQPMVSLLLLWDFVAGSDRRQFTLRLVHTTSAGVYGKAVPCDLVIDIHAGGTIFQDLAFPASEEDVDLFAPRIEIDEADGLGS